MKIKRKYLIAAAGVVGTGLLVIGLKTVLRDSSAPKALLYNVLHKDHHIEFRDYKPYKVAKVTESGDRKSAVDRAFDILFSYIKGKNSDRSEIPMTAPVTQMASDGKWEVNFIMPKKMKELPLPDDQRVTLKKENGGTFIAHRFSGLWNNKNVSKHKQHLDNYINDNGIPTDIDAIYAYYNSPMRLPFARRNEIMYKVK